MRIHVRIPGKGSITVVTDTQRKEAETLRVGLIAGCLGREEIVAWVDGIIEADPAPDYTFIELSTDQSPYDQDWAGYLRAIGQREHHFSACRAVLGRAGALAAVEPGRLRSFAKGL
jgi:hypothetical protein